MALERFYWVAEGALAGSSRPGRLRGDSLAADLAELAEKGIGAIVSLTETPLDEREIRAFGMTYAHVGIVDMTAPSERQMLMALDAIDGAQAGGRAVLVHCLAGQGRTGTILAAWLIRRGATADEAVAEIRSICDGAVENDRQLACLRSFERDRPWIV